MKQFLLTLAIISSSYLYSQTIKPINAKLQKATVYLQGAHLFYNENVNLSAGINEFAFENISQFISQPSLQASVKNGVVMDVKYELVYEEEKPKIKTTKNYEKEIQDVTDSLEDVSYELQDLANKLKALATERNMLLTSGVVAGQTQKDSLPSLEQGMAFLRKKLNEIDAEELKLEKVKNKVTKKQTRLNERYQALLLLQDGGEEVETAGVEPKHRVLVTVYAEAATSTQLSFNYFIQNANWVPAYDLQASSTTSQLKLNYFANVTQASGLDWKNTQLTLSTSTPNESNTKPELSPWYLSFQQYLQNYGLSNSQAPLKNEKLMLNSKDAEKAEDDYKTMLDYIAVSENLLSVEYEIKLNYTLASDGKPHKVLINEKNVPMGLQYAAIPKLSQDAYLMARITGWEDMNIIPGNARLYFDGGYIGEMYLNPNTTEDTMSVNLGRDKSFAITRKKIKEKFKEKFIDNDKIETRSIEIVIRNTKNQTIDIEVEDQIPVAYGTNEIKVILKDGDGAELDEPSGSLKWHLKLKAKETKKLVFTYEIHYPKDKPVAGL